MPKLKPKNTSSLRYERPGSSTVFVVNSMSGQTQILRRMLEEGPKGFEGGMSAKKYMSITGVSKAAATRDIQDLAEKGIFVPTDGGRSTYYWIAL